MVYGKEIGEVLRDEEGMENIMIVAVESSLECIHAAYFSAHMGVPILFSCRTKLPGIIKSYILELNPKEKHPPKPPYMHGYVLG